MLLDYKVLGGFSYGPPWDYSVGPWDYPACATRHLMA
jgi:hypothetical protein